MKSRAKEKRRRADGGCLGFRRRRRTRQAAKRHGEPQAGADPCVSEWGNPAGWRPVTPIQGGRTRGTETSKYPQEEKENIDGPSSGERRGQSPNRARRGGLGVVGAARGRPARNQKRLERRGEEGDTPVRATSRARGRHLSRAGHEESCPKQRGPTRKAKHYRKTDSEPVP